MGIGHKIIMSKQYAISLIIDNVKRWCVWNTSTAISATKHMVKRSTFHQKWTVTIRH